MRIAFIVSAYRTILFHAVGQRLERAGHEVYWLSPNKRWARWLGAHGHPAERVFDLTEHAPEWRDTTAPTATLKYARCKGTKCVLNVQVTDPPYTAGLGTVSVRAKVVEQVRCRRRADRLAWGVDLRCR